MGRGYQDEADAFHTDADCGEIAGDLIREMAITTAMKWDLDICDACVNSDTHDGE